MKQKKKRMQKLYKIIGRLFWIPEFARRISSILYTHNIVILLFFWNPNNYFKVCLIFILELQLSFNWLVQFTKQIKMLLLFYHILCIFKKVLISMWAPKEKFFYDFEALIVVKTEKYCLDSFHRFKKLNVFIWIRFPFIFFILS